MKRAYYSLCTVTAPPRCFCTLHVQRQAENNEDTRGSIATLQATYSWQELVTMENFKEARWVILPGIKDEHEEDGFFIGTDKNETDIKDEHKDDVFFINTDKREKIESEKTEEDEPKFITDESKVEEEAIEEDGHIVYTDKDEDLKDDNELKDKGFIRFNCVLTFKDRKDKLEASHENDIEDEQEER